MKTGSPPLSAEYRGLARQFLRDCDREDEAASVGLKALLRPVVHRLDRYPDRQLRPGAFHALAHAWKALPHEFRMMLECKADPRGRRGTITEVRVHPCHVEDSTWAAGSEAEPGLVLSVHRLTLPTTRRQIISSQLLANVGLHALGRRFERGRDRSHPAVLRDLAKLIQEDMFEDLERFRDNEAVSIATDDGGAWHGLASLVTMTLEKTRTLQFVVRTYIG